MVAADVPDSARLLGVLFTRNGRDIAVISFWRDHAAVAALDSSTSYQRVVREMMASGVLTGGTTVEVLDMHGGRLDDAGSLLASGTSAD